MFGLDKLKKLKQEAEEVKTRLDSIQLTGTGGNGAVKVVCTANKKMVSIDIEDSFYNLKEKGEVQRAILDAMTSALDQADNTAQTEMRGMMPNIPGLGI